MSALLVREPTYQQVCHTRGRTVRPFMYKKSKKLNPHIRKTAQLLGVLPPDSRFRGALPLTPTRALTLNPASGLPSPRPPGGLQLPKLQLLAPPLLVGRLGSGPFVGQIGPGVRVRDSFHILSCAVIWVIPKIRPGPEKPGRISLITGPARPTPAKQHMS